MLQAPAANWLHCDEIKKYCRLYGSVAISENQHSTRYFSKHT